MKETNRFQHFQMIAKESVVYDKLPDFLSVCQTEGVRAFHKEIPAYEETPLIEWKKYAKTHGIKALLIKDESGRFGLKAFKGLGGIYAMFRVVCEKLGLDSEKASFADLQREDNKRKISDMVFITTTDGNHGKGVSWAAGLLGCKAYVYMPVNSVEARAQAIRDAGTATVQITDMKYDDCVRYTAKLADEKGWNLIQDTSWNDYEKIPKWIVQGYTTLFYEASRQMKELGYERPTHVFLQAGVGAMAGGIAGAVACTYGDKLPRISIVEPEEVACIFESARYEDGEPHKAAGSEITIMAGLNCGEPCTITWPILRDFGQNYFACKDEVSAHGMRLLANPLEGDRAIISGESGAVTAGLVSLLLECEAYSELRKQLNLTEDSIILIINSEGDTDPEGYQSIVKGEAYPLT